MRWPRPPEFPAPEPLAEISWTREPPVRKLWTSPGRAL